ncbi:MAG: DUF4282 domain-containing protein [Desulfarculaceae bacterium]|nr:DUF4282 domain-containing protein [Desulfarculaceae bacterium]
MPSFTHKMFNLSFQEFITPSIIKILYVLILIGVAIWFVVTAIAGFAAGFGYGLLYLIGSAIAAAVFAILARVYMEVIMVFFRMLGLLENIAAAKTPAAAPDLGPPPSVDPGVGEA